MSTNLVHLMACLISLTSSTDQPMKTAENEPFSITFGRGGITSLKRRNDVFDTDYIMEGKSLGDLVIRYRVDSSEWLEAATASLPDRRKLETDDGSAFTIAYTFGGPDNGDLELTEHFVIQGKVLSWTIRLQNRSDLPLEIGDIALPLPFSTAYVSDPIETYTKRLMKHSFISGHGSFIYWMRPNGVGPYLVMTPLDGTKLEDFDVVGRGGAWEGEYSAYIHSAARDGAPKRGTWRQPHTSVILSPQGTPASEVSYGFTFRWAKDFDGVRDVLYEEGQFDVSVLPGMTVPNDVEAMFSIRTKNVIRSITLEYPDHTVLQEMEPVQAGKRSQNTHVYRVKFSQLGENLLTVNYGDNRYMVLEFFVTEPLETLIRKRAGFIATRQQHRDGSKWYNGLFSLWDMREKTLRGPDNTGGLAAYMVGGSDDPSNSKCAFLSEKNAVYPDPDEVAALEYFIDNFVWGKHQRTDKEEPHPYAIYGCDNWYACRNSPIGLDSGGQGRERMWRTFDYTTYMMLYYNMYRIAKQNPGMTKYLDAAGYLERAFGTAKAFFVVPYNIKMSSPPWSFRGWCDWAYKQGNFHERYLIELIDALYAEGKKDEADWLKGEWEKKVKYFLYDHPYPYGSEMYFDTTAFESTHVIAKYALEHPLQADENLWQDKNSGRWYSHPKVDPGDAVAFMGKEILTNIAARGWLETTYYYLGSDYRQCGSSSYLLSYMSQMGGDSLLDYGLYFAEDPAEYLRLGYASILSSWALMNTGTPESNYGYWYPGKENDGAVGWAFEPEKFGNTWGVGAIGRGIWPYDGEIDHGLAAGVRSAATVVADDPIFGMVVYGGTLKKQEGRIKVIPRDGVRQRFHVVGRDQRVHILLDRDGFAAETPVILDTDLRRLGFTLENRTGDQHLTILRITGLRGLLGVKGIPSKVRSVDADRQGVEVLLKVGVEKQYQITVLCLEEENKQDEQ